MVAYICWCYSLSSYHPFLLPLCPQVHSLCLHLCSCPANMSIWTIFSRFHIHTPIYNICFPLSDICFHTSLCMTDSRSSLSIVLSGKNSRRAGLTSPSPRTSVQAGGLIPWRIQVSLWTQPRLSARSWSQVCLHPRFQAFLKWTRFILSRTRFYLPSKHFRSLLPHHHELCVH